MSRICPYVRRGEAQTAQGNARNSSNREPGDQVVGSVIPERQIIGPCGEHIKRFRGAEIQRARRRQTDQVAAGDVEVKVKRLIFSPRDPIICRSVTTEPTT